MSVFTLPFRRQVFYQLIHRQKPSIKKPLVNNLFFVNMSDSKKNSMVLQTENVRQKNITRWNIPPKLFHRWLAVAFGVILFQPSVKYRQNNFVGDVTVEVAYAVIFLQLSRIYWRIEFIGNSIRNN